MKKFSLPPYVPFGVAHAVNHGTGKPLCTTNSKTEMLTDTYSDIENKLKRGFANLFYFEKCSIPHLSRPSKQSEMFSVSFVRSG